MAHKLYLLNSETNQTEAFAGLVMPDVLDRLKEQNIFLIGAVDENTPVGAAVLEITQGQAQLLSIAVAEGHRRKGIGSALIRHCVRMLRRTSVSALYAVMMPEETQAAALFEAQGMTSSDSGGAFYRFKVGALAGQKALEGPAPGVSALEKVPDSVQRGYMRKAFPGGLDGETWKAFDPKLSHVMVENGEITAGLMMERENGLSIGWLSSWSHDKMTLPYLLRAALAAVRKYESPETEMRFTTYEPVVSRLADKLLGNQVEKQMICQWSLADYKFRLYDTTPTGWEVEDA